VSWRRRLDPLRGRGTVKAAADRKALGTIPSAIGGGARVEAPLYPSRTRPARVAGHSLRAGLATSAAAAGVPERVIAEQTGHKGTAMLRRYIREGSLFRENAASAVGL
jgi:integrase